MKNISSIRSSKRMVLIAVSVLMVASFSGCENPPSSIVLDNGTSEPMKVTLNEKHEMEIPPYSHERISVAGGKHKFKIESEGKVIYNDTKEVETSSWFGTFHTYLFNPDFNNRYATFDVEYGSSFVHMMEDVVENNDRKNGRPVVEDVAKEFKSLRTETAAMPMSPWFKVPPSVDYYFTEPPDEVYTRNMTEKRTVLVRTTKLDHSIILAADKNENPTEEDYNKLYDAVDQMWYYPTRPTSVETETQTETVH